MKNVLKIFIAGLCLSATNVIQHAGIVGCVGEARAQSNTAFIPRSDVYTKAIGGNITFAANGSDNTTRGTQLSTAGAAQAATSVTVFGPGSFDTGTTILSSTGHYEGVGPASNWIVNKTTAQLTSDGILARLANCTVTSNDPETILIDGTGTVVRSTGAGVMSAASASAARTTLGLGSLATASAITSADITDGTIVNADISASAAIAISKIQMNTAKLLGRSTASAGAVEEITIGSGLDLTSGTLTATTGGGGTVTATGGSLTSNAIVLGAGSTDTKVVAGIVTDGTSMLTLGVNTTTLGKVKLFGSTSGDVTIQPAAVAGTATVLTLPAATDTLVGKATTDTLTNKTLTSPTLTTPVLGTPTSGLLSNCTGLPIATGLTGLTAANRIPYSTSGSTLTTNGSLTYDAVTLTAPTAVFGSTTSLLLGTAGSAVGNIGFRNATSGTATLAPPTGALGTYTVTLPSAAGTLSTGRKMTAMVFPPATNVTTGNGANGAFFPAPATWNGLSITTVRAHVDTAGTTGTTNVQITRIRNGTGVSVLSTGITIDSTETSTDTAATPPVINGSNSGMQTDDFIRLDVTGVSTTAPQGLVVEITTSAVPWWAILPLLLGRIRFSWFNRRRFMAAVSFLALLVSVQATRVRAAANEDIKAAYELENVNDSGGGGLNLTNNNSTTFTTGKLSNAATFNGTNQSLTHANAADLNPGAGQFAGCCWVYIDDKSAIRIFAEKGDGASARSWFVWYYPTADTVYFHAYHGGSASFVDSGFSPTVNTWYWLCWWYDGTNINISVNNGTPVSTAFAGCDDTTTALNVGKDGSSTLFHSGKLDQLVLRKGSYWDSTARTEIYNGGSGLAFASWSTPSSGSFTVSPAAIPKNHAGNITLTLAGTSTSWVNGTSVFTPSGVAGVTKISQNVTSNTAATVVVTTSSTAGTLTITESVTGTATATTAVGTGSFTISPTTGLISTTPTLTLTGTNKVWSQETAAGLFTTSGGTGASIATPTITTNTAGTAVLTVGSAAGTITITDTSDSTTQTFTATSGTITVTKPVSGQTFRVTAPTPGQPTGSTGDILIAGTYTGSPTAIKAKLGSGSYSTIVASPSAGSFTGTLSTQTAGLPATLTVEFSNDSAVNATVSSVSVGDVILAFGASDTGGLGTSNQVLYDVLGYGAHGTGNGTSFTTLADPWTNQVSSDFTGGGSWMVPLAGHFISNNKRSFLVIGSLKSGYAWSQAQQGDSVIDDGVTAAQAAGGPNIIIYWFSNNLLSTPTNVTNINTAVDYLYGVFGVPVYLPRTPPYLGQDPTTSRAAVDQVVATNPHARLLFDPSDVPIEDGTYHYQSTAAFQLQASRIWTSLYRQVYAPSSGSAKAIISQNQHRPGGRLRPEVPVFDRPTRIQSNVNVNEKQFVLAP